jgi:hypothetical protein
MGRFIDFDASRAERNAEPITLKAYGREFTLPPAMPASIGLDLAEMTQTQGEQAQFTVLELRKMLVALIGQATLDELLAIPEFTLDDLSALLVAVFHAYSGKEEAEALPNRAARRHPTTKSQ